MRIVGIEIANYGSFYGNHVFKFENRGLTLVRGDNRDESKMNSNGAGKSTLFDALDWCLFGAVPRKDHVDSIVNSEALNAGEGCGVVVELVDEDGGVILVDRKREKKKTLLSLIKGGEDLSTLDLKETQKVVEAELGLDREIFHAAVLFAQNDLIRYADSTDSERMKVLTRILQLDELDDHLATAKAKKSAADDELVTLNSKLVELTREHERLINEEATTVAKAEAWEQDRINELAGIDTELARYQGEIANIDQQQKSLPMLKERLAGLKEQLGRLDIPVQSTTAQHAVATIDQEIAVLTAKHKDIINKMNELRTLGVMCDRCNQPVSDIHKGDIIGRYDEESGRVYAQTLDLQAKREILIKEAQTANQIYQSALAFYKGEQCRLNNEINTVTSGITSLEQLDQVQLKWNESIVRLENKKVALQQKANPFSLDDLIMYVEGIKANLAEVGQLVEDAKRKIQVCQFWVDAFGPKGLKSYILDSKLPELTESANEWVKLLTGGTHWVQFESQKKTRGKKVVNAPDLRVARHNPDGSITEQNYASFSGGEKRRIAFAVDFGLSRMIARRATKSYDMLILDEVFRHLDRVGKETVVDMINVFASEKNSVFAIEHDPDFEDKFPNCITMVRENRRTRIEE